MPADTENINHLKEWYKKARGSGLILNFALALGKKDDGMMIFVDKRKKATKLLLDAKDEGETNKFAFGTMRVQKDEVFLTCQKKPPAGLAKKVKKYLKLIKMPGAPSRVVIVDGDGQTLEDEVDLESKTEAETEVESVVEVDPAKANWETGIAKIKPAAVARIKAGGPIAERMKQAIQLGMARAEAGDYAAAVKTLPAIAKLLKTADEPEAAPKAPPQEPRPTAEPKPDPGPAKEFAERRAETMSLLANAKKQGSPHANPAQAALIRALEAAKAKEFATGLTLLEQVAAILAQPIPEPEPSTRAAPDAKQDAQAAPDAEPEAEGRPDPEPSEAILALEARLVATARALQASDLGDDLITRLSKALTRAQKMLKDGDEEVCATLLDMIAQELSAPPTAPKPSGAELATQVRKVWDKANKQVSGKISSLRSEFQKVEDPNCQELADKGLISFTGGLYVRLNKSLIELQTAGPDKVESACENADDAFSAFRSMLDSHEAVSLIDDNPFGVPVNMRRTLGDALGQMQDIVRQPSLASQ